MIKNKNVVFNNQDGRFFIREIFDKFADAQTLFDIKIGTRFIKNIEIRILQNRCSNSNALQFSSRKLIQLTIKYFLKFENGNDRLQLLFFISLLEKTSHGTFDLFWNHINGLRFVTNGNRAITNVLKETLCFGTFEVCNEIIKVCFTIETTKVWFELTCQDLECRTLSNTVHPKDTHNFTKLWHG